MSSKKAIVIRLVPPEGSDGFWPRENYFAGEANNGYALRLRPGSALPLRPGAEMKLVVANHVPHLPYAYEGSAAHLPAGEEAVLLFTCRGNVRLLEHAEVEKYVQHGFDPSAVTETRDKHGRLLRQQGRKGDPILYDGKLIDRD